VLVTGGTGFLGAYIIRQLVLEGYQVRALRRSQQLPFFIPEPVLEKVQWIKGDILDIVSLEEAMEGMDAVIHAAAKLSFESRDRDEMFQTNVEGTGNVVNTALALNLKRLIHISSVAALGRTDAGDTVDEGEQWKESKFNTNYATSKYQAEMEVWRAIAEGLECVIVNPSTVIGYGDWNHSSCSIFKTVYEGLPWYTNGVNGFVDVEDIAKAVVLLLPSEISGERFVLSGENWIFRRLFDKIADGFHKKHPSREATPILAAIAWRMEKIKSVFVGKPSILTRESAKISQTKTYFDNNKIKKYLPLFSFTPLEQTIGQACERYLQYVNNS
jgi:dihydroflavonol-4-reductase